MDVSFTWHRKAVLERSNKPEHKISSFAFSAIYMALQPIAVPGLVEIQCANIYPEATDALAPRVKTARFLAAKKTMNATLIRSPEVSFNDPSWQAYRLTYPSELGQLFDDVLVSCAKQLSSVESAAAIELARAACRTGLSELVARIAAGQV